MSVKKSGIYKYRATCFESSPFVYTSGLGFASYTLALPCRVLMCFSQYGVHELSIPNMITSVISPGFELGFLFSLPTANAF